MKIFEQEVEDMQLVYCIGIESFYNDYRIMDSLMSGEYFERFHAEEFQGAENIKNDTRLYITNIGNSVYQICGRASNVNSNIIPNTYLVRKIGTWWED